MIPVAVPVALMNGARICWHVAVPSPGAPTTGCGYRGAP